MKKFLGILALVLGFAFQSNAQGAIKFKSEKHDFGKIVEGTQAAYSFEFTNTGKAPVVISNVQPSCGCTTPVWPKEPILPGQEGKILVTYNTAGRPGTFNKSITITSNADEPSKIITIRGTVTTAPEKNTVPIKEGNMLSPDNQ